MTSPAHHTVLHWGICGRRRLVTRPHMTSKVLIAVKNKHTRGNTLASLWMEANNQRNFSFSLEINVIHQPCLVLWQGVLTSKGNCIWKEYCIWCDLEVGSWSSELSFSTLVCWTTKWKKKTWMPQNSKLYNQCYGINMRKCLYAD